MSEKTMLRLGTRASALARWQADWVADRLHDAGVSVELVLITTEGDARSGPIGGLGGQGVFTKEIQRALLDDRIDLAVHSLKDLPTEPVAGLALTAVPVRERPGDVLVANPAVEFNALRAGARIGTGSMRRRAQILHIRPDLDILDIRGNVDTRLRQLDEGRYEAIVLAEAGLVRLGLGDRITQVLPREWMLPAIGQGALGLETRADDSRIQEVVRLLDDPDSHRAVVAERSLLTTLEGGCLAPIGGWGRVVDGKLHLDAAVLNSDGTQRISTFQSGMPDEAEAIGRKAAQKLLDRGAAELIATSREGR